LRAYSLFYAHHSSVLHVGDAWRCSENHA